MVWPYIAQRTVETAAAWGRWGTMLKTESASAMADAPSRSAWTATLSSAHIPTLCNAPLASKLSWVPMVRWAHPPPTFQPPALSGTDAGPLPSHTINASTHNVILVGLWLQCLVFLLYLASSASDYFHLEG